MLYAFIYAFPNDIEDYIAGFKSNSYHLRFDGKSEYCSENIGSFDDYGCIPDYAICGAVAGSCFENSHFIFKWNYTAAPSSYGIIWIDLESNNCLRNPLTSMRITHENQTIDLLKTVPLLDLFVDSLKGYYSENFDSLVVSFIVCNAGAQAKNFRTDVLCSSGQNTIDSIITTPLIPVIITGVEVNSKLVASI